MSDFLNLGLNMPSAMGYPVPSWVKPGAAVDIDFINNRAWFAGLQSSAFARVPYVRSSTATYYDADGIRQTAPINTPRFHYDPLTGVPLGFLSESGMSNYVRYSNDFTNALWSKTGLTVTPNTIIGPDGTMSGSKIEANTASFVNCNQPVTNSALSTTGMTFSCHFKKGSGATDGGRILLRNNTTSVNLATGNFNFDTGVLTVTGGGTGKVEVLKNGWFRLSVTSVTGWSNNDTATGYLGFTGGSGELGKYVYIADSMLERWSGPTSYYPTTSAVVSRAYDKGDLSVSQFAYNPDEGTFFIEDSLRSGMPITYVSGSVGLHDDNAANNELIRHVYYFPSPLLRLGSNGRTVATTQWDELGTVNFDTVNRTAFAYKANDAVTSVNGSAVISDTSVVIPPALLKMAIGRNRAFDSNLNGLSRRITYWPKRLTNAEVIALST